MTDLVTFGKFSTSGTGETKNSLGRLKLGTHMMNAVELQFDVPTEVHDRYTALKPRQWLGPAVVWESPGGTEIERWDIAANDSRKGGDDDPDPSNISTARSSVAYYDSPGPSLLKFTGRKIKRVSAIQNFTGWVEGRSKKTGKIERISLVTGWHSIVDLECSDWSNGGFKWDFQATTRAGLGWADVQV